MKTSEIVYMVLDLAKASPSDDSYFTEDHALFLCKKYRAFLIKKEQEKNRDTTDTASEFEYQQICLNMDKVEAIEGVPCAGGYYMRSKEAVPKVVEGSYPKVYPTDYYQGVNISFVSRDRMRYVGYNKFLKNIYYVSIGPDMHLYMTSNNPQHFYLKKLRMSAVFENFDEVANLLCDNSGESAICDVLDMEFPIREHLVPLLIELVVKELTGAVYKPKDEHNNANDDLSKR